MTENKTDKQVKELADVLYHKIRDVDLGRAKDIAIFILSYYASKVKVRDVVEELVGLCERTKQHSTDGLIHYESIEDRIRKLQAILGEETKND